MFDSIGWSEILILVVAGLFILGPERLPSAAAWLGRSVRKVREYASGAREQLRSEMGDDTSRSSASRCRTSSSYGTSTRGAR